VWIQESSENVIAGNNIVDSEWGIGLDYSPNNEVYHNYFAANDRQVVFINARINIWDNGYPSGGNYWSNYTGLDLCSGPYQNVAGSDGIGDTSHVIDGNNTDRYPLMQPYNGPVRNLNTGESYTTIQGAINNASEGNRIFVLSGTYYEHVTINKSISLIGENKSTTIVDGSGTGTIFNVTANGVSLSGFTIQNSGTGGSGIQIHKCINCNITSNILSDNGDGIIIVESGGNTISDNKISNCFSLLGIDCISSNNNKIINNTLLENFHGIRIYNCGNNNLTGNTVKGSHYGIHISKSASNFLRNNELISNTLNFGVYAENLTGYIQDIDTSNTVNGKPICYFVNSIDLTLNPSTFPEVGYIAIVNSTKITVNNLTINNNEQGLLLAYTNHSVVDNLNLHENEVGIRMTNGNNNTISGNTMSWDSYMPNANGISFWKCDNNTIGWNAISDCWIGINGWLSNGNLIERNTLTSSERSAIFLSDCGSSIIKDNKLLNSLWDGLYLDSDNTVVYHNSFINNLYHAHVDSGHTNVWDNGYPSGGNYWSGYTGVDANMDGIGDNFYEIDANNIDHYPLMGMFSDFNATSEYHVQTICNSSISNFQFNGTAISFNVTGENGTAGFCRICIPTALMNDTFRVFVNGTEILQSPEPLPCSNSTHNYLYFTYDHSTQEVVIIPEFPTWTSMLLILIMLTVASVIYKRRLLKTPIP